MLPTFSFMKLRRVGVHRQGCCLSLLLGAFIALALLSSSYPAEADTRVALVIGNSVYKKASSLANPVHDAEDTAAALQRLGFKVSAFHDADFTAFRKAILDFNRVAQGADIAVVYFAGHGIEVDGENWLLPTDVELRNDVDASTEAISLRSAMSAVGPAKTLGLVILDACRNNPFQSTMQRSSATREVHVGLRSVETSDNVLVAYAARDGTVAVDGRGRNSPFTSALLRHLETPGLEVDFLFRNVRDDVRAATNDAQQPFVYGSLSSEEIYLNPPRLGQAEPAATVDAAEVAWSFLKTTSDVGALTRFSDRFPASAFASEARARIASLTATAMSSPGVGENKDRPIFTENAPDNAELEQAEKEIARRFLHDGPAVKAAWDIIKESKDHAVIRRFVDQFPSGQRRLNADQRLADLGQHPITTRITPFAPATAPFAAEGGIPPPADEIAVMAARDGDVLECFRTADGGSCERALQHYPELPRLPANPLFVIGVCGSLGKSDGGCRLFIDANWHFPALKKVATAEIVKVDVGGIIVGVGGDGNGNGGGGGNGGGARGGGGNGGGDRHGHDFDKDKGLRRSGKGDDEEKKASGRAQIGKSERSEKQTGGASVKAGNARNVRVRTSHVKLDAEVTTPNVKVSNPKAAGTNARVSHVDPSQVNAPKVNAPAVKSPTVNVPAAKTPTVNVRVPTINVPVRVPGH
jgi:hypothetical protein